MRVVLNKHRFGFWFLASACVSWRALAVAVAELFEAPWQPSEGEIRAMAALCGVKDDEDDGRKETMEKKAKKKKYAILMLENYLVEIRHGS